MPKIRPEPALSLLRPPAPLWRVTLALASVILAGVGLSFVVFFYTNTQVNLAVARQIERPVVKVIAQIQGQVNAAYDLLRSLQQVVRMSPQASGEVLGGFTSAVNQTQVAYAGVYMVEMSTGQDDQRKVLSAVDKLPLPHRLKELESGLAGLLEGAARSDKIVSGMWNTGDKNFLMLVGRCHDDKPDCVLLASLALPDMLQGLDAMVVSHLINNYSITEQTAEQEWSERNLKPIFARRTNQPQVGTIFENMVRTDHVVLQDRVWVFRYYAQPDRGSQLVLILPYLVIMVGLVLTGVVAIYVINNYEYEKEVYSLTGSLQGSNRRLQERIAAESALSLAQKASERKYRAIFENAGIGICQIALDGSWLAANPRMAQILGYKDAEEVLRLQPDKQDLLFINASARQSFLAGLDRQGQTDTEVAVRHRDGSTIWVNMRGHVVRDAEDAPLYYECTMYDVTQRRQSELALRTAKEQADMANRSKSEFLANMSHELRTPLNAIIGFSEIIKDQLLGTEGTPQYIEYAKDIHDSGALLLSLINDILDMSKIEAGKRNLSETSLDIERMAQSCIRLVAVRAKAGGVHLTHNIPANLPPLRAEERAIKQVLVNLLTNAIKFTPEGGIVTIKASIDPFGRLGVGVEDTGIGIAAADIPIAMAPFGQIESVMSRKTQGTGLGLPLTKALVELHGGELKIVSAVGQGTTVTAIFPAERVLGRVA